MKPLPADAARKIYQFGRLARSTRTAAIQAAVAIQSQNKELTKLILRAEPPLAHCMNQGDNLLFSWVHPFYPNAADLAFRTFYGKAGLSDDEIAQMQHAMERLSMGQNGCRGKVRKD